MIVFSIVEVFDHPLPQSLKMLNELALDLRWTWSHEADKLWSTINHEVWDKTENPWFILNNVSRVELQKLSKSPVFRQELHYLVQTRKEYLGNPGWFKQNFPEKTLNPIAYFSMEFGVGEALPLYAGGLGILAGDYLKTASDLKVPLVGIGLLYQEGYFRQILDGKGCQIEAYPYNDPISLPIRPVMDTAGSWLRVPLELPGRKLWIKVWQAQVGYVKLYLLDSNDPLNSPRDRGITNKLYDNQPDIRLMQEMVLGIGGWRVLEALAIPVEVCHLNEGHTAFVVLERARALMQKVKAPFPVALCATRVGNVFTTHTPVAAGFDSFSADSIAWYFRDYLQPVEISLEQLLMLGRKETDNKDEPFNMSYLAMRGSGHINGVSQLHGKVSRRIFQSIYAHWPEDEVPISYITNGAHMPSWDSEAADELWTKAYGKARWLHKMENITEVIKNLTDTDLWVFRMRESQQLIAYVRQRLAYQLSQKRANFDGIKEVQFLLDAKVLTIGFARRFTAYKRPNLILTDEERLVSIISNPDHPVQLIVAGKAHPDDQEGKCLVQQFVKFAEKPSVRGHVVFLEDYDLSVAQHLVAGVDLWLNTPMRPWEACGTSGMKVLVNGGLNISELDGWWAEAYTPEVGWALGDGRVHSEPSWNEMEAKQLYELLENEIIPKFYDRNDHDVPVGWVALMRASMAHLAPRFSSNRMLREYVENSYLPATKRFRQLTSNDMVLAQKIYAWQTTLGEHWHDLQFGTTKVNRVDNHWQFEVPVYLGQIAPESISVELYADPINGQGYVIIPMARGEKIIDTKGGYTYRTQVRTDRPAEHFTARIIPAHEMARVPLEDSHILWQR